MEEVGDGEDGGRWRKYTHQHNVTETVSRQAVSGINLLNIPLNILWCHSDVIIIEGCGGGDLLWDLETIHWLQFPVSGQRLEEMWGDERRGEEVEGEGSPLTSSCLATEWEVVMVIQNLREFSLSKSGQKMEESWFVICCPQSTQLGQECDTETLSLTYSYIPHVHVVPYC